MTCFVYVLQTIQKTICSKYNTGTKFAVYWYPESIKQKGARAEIRSVWAPSNIGVTALTTAQILSARSRRSRTSPFPSALPVPDILPQTFQISCCFLLSLSLTFYPVFYYECSNTGCQTFFLQPLVGTTVFSSLSSLLIFLENDFVKNKSAVRCSFLYFLGLFSKAFFILLHRRCDKLSLF